MIIISIFSIIFLLVAITYIIIAFLQRKNRISKDYFEVYTDVEIKFVFYLIFASMFTFFCCFIPFTPDDSFAAIIPCFVFQIIFIFLAINYCRPKIKIKNDSLSILKIFVYREILLKNILEIKFKNNKMVLIIENGNKYLISNYCINFERFAELLKNNNIKYDNKFNSQVIRIRATLLATISGQFLSFAFIVAGILIIKYADSGQNLWFAYIFVLLGLFMLVLFSLFSFRWKIDIDKNTINYVPLIGKKRTYDARTIEKIHISASYGYKGAKLKEISLILSKVTIHIPYRSAGVQQLINTYKHKVTYDSEA